MAKKKGMTCVLFNEKPEGTHYRAGSYSWVADSTADEYIEKGYAVEHDPAETRKKRFNQNKPTQANTVKQIKRWLDNQGIEYSDENKAGLLELVENA